VDFKISDKHFQLLVPMVDNKDCCGPEKVKSLHQKQNTLGRTLDWRNSSNQKFSFVIGWVMMIAKLVPLIWWFYTLVILFRMRTSLILVFKLNFSV